VGAAPSLELWMSGSSCFEAMALEPQALLAFRVESGE
jgi:hypothetical protein